MSILYLYKIFASALITSLKDQGGNPPSIISMHSTTRVSWALQKLQLNNSQ